MRRDRSPWLLLAVLGLAPCAGGAEPAAEASPPVVWHDVAGWGVEGRLWEDEPRAAWFERFPAAAKATVPGPVWDLSRHSAGMLARFRTDATAIQVRVALVNAELGMPHMPATGASGVDLYARDDAGRWRWVAAARPERQQFTAALVAGLAPGSREYAAYLPLFNGVEALAIGVPEGAAFEGLAPRGRPIVLVEDRRNTNAWILPGRARHHDDNHAALRESFAALQEKGVANLHYLPGDDLLGDDAEGTVDASHPTDLGFMRQADAFEPVLRAAVQADMPRATSGAK